MIEYVIKKLTVNGLFIVSFFYKYGGGAWTRVSDDPQGYVGEGLAPPEKFGETTICMAGGFSVGYGIYDVPRMTGVILIKNIR